MLGSKTLDNATVIIFDYKLMNSTKPWLKVNEVNLGSLSTSYKISNNIQENIFNSKPMRISTWNLKGHFDNFKFHLIKKLLISYYLFRSLKK